MTDRAIGQLEAKVDTLQQDVSYIKTHMVTRREFETAKAEHKPLEARLSVLETEHHRAHWQRKLADKLFWGILLAGLAAFGVKLL